MPTTQGLRLARMAAIRRSENERSILDREPRRAGRRRSAVEEAAPPLAEHADQPADQVAIGLAVPPAAAGQGAPGLRFEPLLARLGPHLLGLELSGPRLAASLHPGQPPRQLVEVEPDAVGAADVEDDAALAAVVLAVHQGTADGAGPVEMAAGRARAPACAAGRAGSRRPRRRSRRHPASPPWPPGRAGLPPPPPPLPPPPGLPPQHPPPSSLPASPQRSPAPRHRAAHAARAPAAPRRRGDRPTIHRRSRIRTPPPARRRTAGCGATAPSHRRGSAASSPRPPPDRPGSGCRSGRRSAPCR